MNIFKKLFKKEERIFFEGDKVFLQGDKFVLMKEDYQGEIEKLFGLIEKNKRETDYKGTLREALRELNRENFGETDAKSFVAGIQRGDRFYIAHGGRSRFYLYRDNEFSLITTDDTEAFNLFNNGMIKYEDTVTHRLAAIMKKAMSLNKELDLNIYDFYIKEGDLLFFVDHEFLADTKDEEIETILRSRNYKEIKKETGSYILYKM